MLFGASGASRPEEKLLRSIFGEKATDVRDSSLKLPPGSGGVVVDVRVFNRHGVEKDERTIAIERAGVESVQEDKQVEEEILERNIKLRLNELLIKEEVSTCDIDEVSKSMAVAQLLSELKEFENVKC